MPAVSIPGTTPSDLIKTHLADLEPSTTAWSGFLSTAPGISFDARPASTDHWLNIYRSRRDVAVTRNWLAPDLSEVIACFCAKAQRAS